MKSVDSTLVDSLKHHFIDSALIKQALTHSSFGKDNNERLEFLGDAILGWIISEKLYAQFPEAAEGQLSRLRSGLVKGATLAEVAKELNLGEYIRFGRGELKSGGNSRESTLANTLEAVIGAIYLDSNSQACRDCVLAWFDERLQNLSREDPMKDAKTRLQELLQSGGMPVPEYEILSKSGKDHEQMFEIGCRVPGLNKMITGTGSSRRKAEQQAAGRALEILES